MKKWSLLAAFAASLCVAETASAQFAGGCLSTGTGGTSGGLQTSSMPGGTQIFRGSSGSVGHFANGYSSIDSYATGYSSMAVPTFAAQTFVAQPVVQYSVPQYAAPQYQYAAPQYSAAQYSQSLVTTSEPLVSSSHPVLNAAQPIVANSSCATADGIRNLAQTGAAPSELYAAPVYFNSNEAVRSTATMTQTQAYRLAPSAGTALSTSALTSNDIGQSLVLETNGTAQLSRVTNAPQFEGLDTDATAATTVGGTVTMRQTVMRRRHLIYPDGRVVSGQPWVVGTRDLAQLRLSASQVASLRSSSVVSTSQTPVIDLRTNETLAPVLAIGSNSNADRLKTIEDELARLAGTANDVQSLRNEVQSFKTQYESDQATLRQNQSDLKESATQMRDALEQWRKSNQ